MQNRMSVVGVRGKRLIVETNMPRGRTAMTATAKIKSNTPSSPSKPCLVSKASCSSGCSRSAAGGAASPLTEIIGVALARARRIARAAVATTVRTRYVPRTPSSEVSRVISVPNLDSGPAVTSAAMPLASSSATDARA